MSFLVRALLIPFAVLYDLGTRVRNHLFDIGHFRSIRFEIPVISVGNLSVGGSGKTPLVEHILRLLKNDLRCSVISRGYGRSSRGLRIADGSDDAATLGDEPYQIWSKYGSDVAVAVCEERAYAIPQVLQERKTDVVILDDAFQHRSVSATLSILVTEYGHPFYSDFILPAGRLRETRTCARRAHIVVVSKCPTTITVQERDRIQSDIREYAGKKPVYFASLRYGNVLWKLGGPLGEGKVILITGVANPDPLAAYLSSKFGIVRHLRYRDHHRYNSRDVQFILDVARKTAGPFAVLTTEKDWGKLSRFAGTFSGMRIGVVPIEYQFIGNGSEFDQAVKHAAGLS